MLFNSSFCIHPHNHRNNKSLFCCCSILLPFNKPGCFIVQYQPSFQTSFSTQPHALFLNDAISSALTAFLMIKNIDPVCNLERMQVELPQETHILAPMHTNLTLITKYLRILNENTWHSAKQTSILFLIANGK